MAKLLLGISILLTLITAALGFLTKQKVDALQGNLKQAKTSLASAQADVSKAKSDKKKAEEEMATAKAAQQASEQQLGQLKSDLDKANANVKELEDKVKEAMNKGATTSTDGTPQAGPTQAELDQAKADLAKAQTELAEAKQVQDTLNQRVQAAEEKSATEARKVQEYQQGYVRQGLSGKVLAYNPGWNFAVLSLGDKQGLKAGVTMIIARGGRQIGRLKVTSVEPGTAIGDVVPGSLPKGESVQPGDTVIYQGGR